MPEFGILTVHFNLGWLAACQLKCIKHPPPPPPPLPLYEKEHLITDCGIMVLSHVDIESYSRN